MAPPTKPAADSGKPIGRQLYEATRDGNEEEVDALLRKGAPVSFMSVQFHPQWCFVERVVGSTRSSASGVIFVDDGHAKRVDHDEVVCGHSLASVLRHGHSLVKLAMRVLLLILLVMRGPWQPR